jgi:hypothetical protein
MVRANLAITAGQQAPQDLGRAAIRGDRIGDDVGRTNAMLCEQRVKAGQRVDVLEPLVRARGGVPLIVSFGVDADQQVHATAPHRS